VTSFHAALGIAVVAANLLAGAIGAFAWWRGAYIGAFWPLLRIGQVLVAIAAIDGIVLTATGHDLPELHLVYGLTPLGVSFLAEQLRLAAADSVLQARDLEDSRAVGELPDDEQREVVHAIIRRETGVMAASALVVVVLALRAGGWL
jgi:hypothetical protein